MILVDEGDGVASAIRTAEDAIETEASSEAPTELSEPTDSDGDPAPEVF